mmetsp:Transcript_25687/g.83271  ORF Transcript_25687/g.83271 Transcript_25687/m.83271 type:complete len:818 (-) Transcript_25687:15-2468(-)
MMMIFLAVLVAGASAARYELTASEDTMVLSSEPDTFYGDAVELIVDQKKSGGPAQALVKFDLSAIPDTEDVTTATLTIYCTNKSPGPINVSAVVGVPWSDDSTWNSLEGGIADDERRFSFAIDRPRKDTPYSNDVTNDVQDWHYYDSTPNNQGWVFTTPSTNGFRFWSSEYGGPLVPKLVVETVVAMSLRSAVDTNVWEGAPDDAIRGAEAESITVDASDICSGCEAQGLLKFDLTQVVEGTLLSAILTIVGNNPSAGPVSGHVMLRPWTQFSTWNSLDNGVNLGTDARTAASFSVANPDGGDTPYSFDVTNDVQEWLDLLEDLPNEGWVFVNPSANGFDFWSSDAPDANLRPTLDLVIDNAVPVPTASPVPGEPTVVPAPVPAPTASPIPAPIPAPTTSPVAGPFPAPTASPVPGAPIPAPTASPFPAPVATPTTSPVATAPTASCGPVTYYPGDLTVDEGNGLLLSTGLTAKRIAVAGERVRYANGGRSSVNFHGSPDAGACFPDPSGSGGWAYASNAERTSGGGVGAIRFDAKGDVIEYEMILTGTRRNCGGGKSPWGTWITCEEDGSSGEVWECDPFDASNWRKTVLGSTPYPRGNFESSAYDNRTALTFFVTEDSTDGALRRWRPTSQGPAGIALGAEGTMDYLDLKSDGTFEWTSSKSTADTSASRRYRQSEGIDVRDGTLYFVSKAQKELFILDLDLGTYERSSTSTGAFEAQPDQLKRIVGDDVLYFCEDGGSACGSRGCGVHGRDSTNQFFNVVDAPGYSTETTGLAFSPDRKHMYFSLQGPGHIFDVTRTDGCPFDGGVLDIKYHGE